MGFITATAHWDSSVMRTPRGAPAPQTAEKCHAASPFHTDRTAPGSHRVFRSRDQGKSLSASAGQRKRRLTPESPLGRHRIRSERLGQFAAIAVEVSLRFSWGAGVFDPRGPDLICLGPVLNDTRS